MNYQQIVAAYAGQIILSGSEEYIPLVISESFLRDLAQNGYAVIGIEIFEIENGFIKPRTDLIAEWSSVVKNQKTDLVDYCHGLAKSFLNTVDKGANRYANFCCLDPSEVAAASS